MRAISLFFLITLGLFSCSDDAIEEALKDNKMSAVIDNNPWVSTQAYVQTPSNESGPMKVVGESNGYVIEIFLGNIDGPGTYKFGTRRSANVKFGGSNYSTIDLPDAGTITIIKLDDHVIEAEFSFVAQWLSSNNKITVENGKFKVFKF